MEETFDLILFDLDGTLTDSGEGITKSVQYALSKFGIDEPDLNNLRKFIGPPLVDSFMKYYGFSREEALEVRRVFNERYHPIGWKENHPYPGIEKVLEALKADGKLLGVATSKPEDMAEKVLERFDLRNYFAIVCAAPQNGLNSEKEYRIRAAMEEADAMGYEVKRPVLVGDTRYDVEGAHACGIPCIGVAWGFAAEGEFEACHADYVAESMEDLLRLLGAPQNKKIL